MKTTTEHSLVRNFQNIPFALRKQFLELSKLAYEGFEKEEVIFYSDIGEHFGFLDAVPDLYGGCDVSFNFLHLTLQEFFAAYHISHMPDSGVELFRRKGEDKRWNVVWRFVAGLTEFKFFLDSPPVAVVLNKKEELSTFFIQCLFEAQSMKLDFKSTFGYETMLCRNCTTSLDHYALGYCIANCTTIESSWGITLRSPMDRLMSPFSQGLMSNKFSTGVIKHLHIYWHMLPFTEMITSEYLQECTDFANESPLRHITNLSICNAILTSSKEKIHLFEAISHMPHLITLDISSCDFGHSYFIANKGGDADGLLKLLQYLPHSKVTSLDIKNTRLEYFLEESHLAPCYRTAFQSLTSPSSNLEQLSIEPCNNVQHCDGYRTIITYASSGSSLRHLSLGLKKDYSLLDAFETSNKITHLEIVCSGDKSTNWPATVPYVARIIQHNTTLETLVLNMFNCEDSNVLRDITTELRRNTNLKHLHLNAGKYDTQLAITLEAIDSRLVLTGPSHASRRAVIVKNTYEKYIS